MLERLSVSILNDYLPPYGCPRMCYLKHVQRIPKPTPPAFAFGIAFHSAVEQLYRSRVAGKPLSQDEAVTRFTQEWQTQARKVQDWQNLTAAGQESMGRAMIIAYYQSPECQEFFPDQIEAKAVYRLNGVPFSLRVDMIDQLGYLYDLKTAKPNSWNQKKADEERQATAYLCWAATQTDLNPNKFFYHIVEKCLEPRVFTVKTTRTQRQRDEFGQLVAETWRKMQAGAWGARQWSHCRYCDYGAQCVDDLGDFA